MAALHETAYPCLKSYFDDTEIQELFTPTQDELEMMHRKTKASLPMPKLGFMLLLKCYQCLGRPTIVNKISQEIKQHIAKSMHIDPDIDLSSYDTSARKRHISIIRKYLQINMDKASRRKCMKKMALDAAAVINNLDSLKLPLNPDDITLLNEFCFEHPNLIQKTQQYKRQELLSVLNTKINRSCYNPFMRTYQPKRDALTQLRSLITTNSTQTIATVLSEWRAGNLSIIKNHRNVFFSPKREVITNTEILINKLETVYGHIPCKMGG